MAITNDIKTAKSVQEMGNLSFDTTYNLNAVEMLQYNPSSSAMERFVSPTTTYLTKIDEADASTTYVGDAVIGTASSSALWRIKKLLVSGTVTTITLDGNASSVNNFYSNQYVVILSGTGVGQSRLISSYVGSTKVATVDTAWATTPDSTSVFATIPFFSVESAVWNATTASHATAGTTGQHLASKVLTKAFFLGTK